MAMNAAEFLDILSAGARYAADQVTAHKGLGISLALDPSGIMIHGRLLTGGKPDSFFRKPVQFKEILEASVPRAVLPYHIDAAVEILKRQS
jgi:hypothetical protein